MVPMFDSALLGKYIDGVTGVILLLLALLSICTVGSFLIQWYKQRRIVSGLKQLIGAVRKSQEADDFQSFTHKLASGGLSGLRCACVTYLSQQTVPVALGPSSEGLDHKAVLESAVQVVLVQIESGRQFLRTCASIAPLLGLLGTVWGLITLFYTYGAQAHGMPIQAAGSGIAQALITTIAGLVVAIPATVSIGLLSRMSERNYLLCEQLLWETQMRVVQHQDMV